MFSRCCLQTLPPAAGPRVGLKSRDNRCPPAVDLHLLLPRHCCPAGSPVGLVLQPCNIMYCNGGQGLEDAGKGETQQPPAHTQMWGRAGCRLWSGWSSTFGEKKIIRQKTAEFSDPAARLFLVTQPGWALQPPHEGFCFGLLSRSRN